MCQHAEKRICESRGNGPRSFSQLVRRITQPPASRSCRDLSDAFPNLRNLVRPLHIADVVCVATSCSCAGSLRL